MLPTLKDVARPLAAFLLLALSPLVVAYPAYLQQFQAAYPASTTDQASCATCHASAAGGPPWNAFGRDLIANGADVGAAGNISAALLAVQSVNSDAVAGNNLTEIQAGTQPGWCDAQTAGCVNQTYNHDGSNAGPGTPPATLALDDGSVATPEPNILVVPQALDFGPVLLGQSKSQLVNIINTGSLDLTLSTAMAGTGFALTSAPTAVLTSGQSTSAVIEYTPLAEASNSGSLTLNSNDPDSPSVIIALAGSGVLVLPEPEGVCPAGSQLLDPLPASIATGTLAVGFETVAEGFVNPLLGIAPPGDSERLFVVDQPGQIWAVDLATGTKTLFLDLSARLVELGLFGLNYDERGLLGAAFAPDYLTSGLLYTYQSEPATAAADFSTMPAGLTANHQSVIVEWRVTAPRSPLAVVNPASARVVMRVDQPQFNHNGGSLLFGPDGMLYITLGDGGGADDEGDDGDYIGHSPMGNGQDTSNILGAILRIDPRGSNAPNGEYGIPSDNPFVDPADFAAGNVGGEAGCADGTCDEIYAHGFRNTWRASFDGAGSNALIVADVGQNDIEEIDVVTPGGNYGWRIKDGAFCFDPNGINSGFVTDAQFTGPPNIIDPVAQYDHDEGISVTGGFVYRGSAIPALQGHYVFGDWSTSFVQPIPGRLFYLETANIGTPGIPGPSTILEFTTPGHPNGVGTKINGFGRDNAGEIYVLGSESGLLDGTTGKVRKIVPAQTPGC